MFILISLGVSTFSIILMNDYHLNFIDDFDFPFYDYLIVIDLPGVWFPFKTEVCIDFSDTWLGEEWPC